MSTEPAPSRYITVKESLPPSSFLTSVRPLHKLRYFAFVVFQIASLGVSVALLGGIACKVMWYDVSGAQFALTSTVAIFSGTFGAWMQRLAKNESHNLADQQKQELQMERFHAEQDQRRMDNALRDELVRKLDTLPTKDREKIISECLGRLMSRQTA